MKLTTRFCIFLFALLIVVGVSAATFQIVRAHRAHAAEMHASGAAVHLWHCGMHPQVIEPHPGECPICHMALTPVDSDSAATASVEKKILYWWDPMLGPSSISDHPGKSAMGMEMVPVYAEAGGPQITIDPMVVQNMGVRTAAVTRGPLGKTLITIGMLKIPEPAMHDVSLKVGGWIDKLYADQEGMHVASGEVLFDLYSPDLQVAAQELIGAVKSQQAMDAATGPAMVRGGKSMVESAKRKLRLWDIADEDINAIAKADQPPRTIPIRSPAMGHIAEKMIVAGSAIQPMMKLMRIEDHSTLWLDAVVYENQIASVKPGQQVVAGVDGLPDKSWKGSITFLYPHLDHMTRTLNVRMTLDNPNLELRPGMYATARIMTEPLADAIQIPREAVIDTGTRQIVFIAEADGHFSPRKVRMGMIGDDDRAQIIEGLAPGEMVVTSGQFLMDVESRTLEATQKLSQTPMMEPPQPAPKSSTEPAAETQNGSMSPMTTMQAASQPRPSSQPFSTTQSMRKTIELSVAYCPMAKASWLQPGEKIANPYLGLEMPTCGTVQRKVNAPADGSPLAIAVQRYLEVKKSLEVDKLDSQASAALSASVNALSGAQYDPLKDAESKFASSKEIKSARLTFAALNQKLIAAIEQADR